MSTTLKTRALIAVVLIVLLIGWFQPWSYNAHGFAETTVVIPNGQLRIEVLDQALKDGQSHCLFSRFSTRDAPGEDLEITIDRVGTTSEPALKTNVALSGKTFEMRGMGEMRSFLEGPSVAKLLLPADEPVQIVGSVRYKGVEHRFDERLELKHWEKARKVIKFCV